ncbi:MAG: hypothetical protein R3C30_04685 [Hyphomonadaceae bacterium]
MAPSSAWADRRVVLKTAAATLLINAVSKAWASERPVALDRWARELVGLNAALREGSIAVSEWQTRVEILNTSVPVADLARFLDIDHLTRRFTYSSNLADIVDPVLPADVLGAEGRRNWFIRVFGMRRGGAVIPHVHNNMVSAHLVLSGSFRARTADRLRDESDAVVLRPTRDGVVHVGDILSMSDQRDNQHWLVAQEDRSMTFDVGVVGTPASWGYGLQANAYNMIFVDVDRPADRDGTIRAPVMSFEACAAKYAP